VPRERPGPRNVMEISDDCRLAGGASRDRAAEPLKRHVTLLGRGIRLEKISMLLRVLGRPSSSNSQPVIWPLAELGFHPPERTIGESSVRLSTADTFALTRWIIPVIEGDFVLWESKFDCR